VLERPHTAGRTRTRPQDVQQTFKGAHDDEEKGSQDLESKHTGLVGASRPRSPTSPSQGRVIERLLNNFVVDETKDELYMAFQSAQSHNAELIRELEQENRSLVESLNEVQKERESILFSTRNGTYTTHEDLRQEEKVVSLRRQYDSMQQKTRSRVEVLERLQQTLHEIRMDEVKKISQIQSPLVRRLIHLVNRLDEAGIRTNEALSIQHTYTRIKEKLQADMFLLHKELNELEAEVEVRRAELDRLRTIKDGALNSLAVVEKDCDAVRENVTRQRKQNEKDLKKRTKSHTLIEEWIRTHRKKQDAVDEENKKGEEVDEEEKGVKKDRSSRRGRGRSRHDTGREVIREEKERKNEEEEENRKRTSSRPRMDSITAAKAARSRVRTSRRRRLTSEDGEEAEDAMRRFEEAFVQIRTATGCSDIDDIVRRVLQHREMQQRLTDMHRELSNVVKEKRERWRQLKDQLEKSSFKGSSENIPISSPSSLSPSSPPPPPPPSSSFASSTSRSSHSAPPLSPRARKQSLERQISELSAASDVIRRRFQSTSDCISQARCGLFHLVQQCVLLRHRNPSLILSYEEDLLVQSFSPTADISSIISLILRLLEGLPLKTPSPRPHSFARLTSRNRREARQQSKKEVPLSAPLLLGIEDNVRISFDGGRPKLSSHPEDLLSMLKKEANGGEESSDEETVEEMRRRKKGESAALLAKEGRQIRRHM